MFWFDKQDERALFVDKRRETWPIDIGTPGTIGRSPIVVDPDELADFTALPYPDAVFSLVVFDPPHIERTEAKGLLTKKYGHLTGNWREDLRQGFAECFRVLKPHGTLIFKWAESDHPVSEVLKLTPEKPLFGHRSGKQSTTHWIAFMKTPNAEVRGALVVDLPLRKIAVYANGSGNVVIAALEDGKQSIVLLDPSETTELIANLESAKISAEEFCASIEADTAIWAAQGGGV